jgi:hypothetical protein
MYIFFTYFFIYSTHFACLEACKLDLNNGLDYTFVQRIARYEPFRTPIFKYL